MSTQPEVNLSKQQYRNASYQGCLQENQRSGFGIILTDSSEIIMANWVAHQIQGKYCIISERIKAYGEVLNKKPEGIHVIEVNGMSIYANFREGQLDGRIIIAKDQNYTSLSYQKGRLLSRSPQKHTSQTALAKLLQKEYPQTPLTLQDFLIKLVEQSTSQGIPFGRVELSQRNVYFGVANKEGEGEGLGCVVRNLSQLYSCGQYEHNELCGLGRVYLHQSCVEDGVFKNGKAKGVMITHNRVEQEYTILINGNRKTEKGNPQKLIREIRKEFHLRSTVFKNEIIVPSYLLGIDFEKFINEQIQLEQAKKPPINQVYKIYNMDIENGRYFRRTGEQDYRQKSKSKQRSNKRNDLYLEDFEEEQVSGSSPIKQVHALHVQDSSHFVKEKNEKILIEEPEQSRVSMYRPEVHFQRLTPLVKQQKSSFNHNQSQSSKNQSQSQSSKTQASMHSTKSNKHELAQKDVYSMVKHLQDEQNRKRIDLHKIYRETGLVSKARKLNR